MDNLPQTRIDLFLSCFNMNTKTHTDCFPTEGTTDTIEANLAGVSLTVNEKTTAL